MNSENTSLLEASLDGFHSRIYFITPCRLRELNQSRQVKRAFLAKDDWAQSTIRGLISIIFYWHLMAIDLISTGGSLAGLGVVLLAFLNSSSSLDAIVAWLRKGEEALEARSRALQYSPELTIQV